MFTKRDYRKGKCTTSEYYSQFVTEQTKRQICSYIGKNRLIESTDEHFNDIPLKDWEGFDSYYSGVITLSDAGQICVKKEAARQVLADIRRK